jgi:hypothetical protein
LIPFVGPYFNFAYDPNLPWVWTPGRGWLEVLPGAVTVFGGLLLLTSRNRATALLGGWLAVVAGAWFVVGRLFAVPWKLGDFGSPAATTLTGQLVSELAFFTGLGSLIILFGALALGRLSVRSVRDIRYAERAVVPAEYQSTVDGERTRAGRRVVDAPVDEPDMPRRHWGWRGMFGRHDRTPVPH